MIKVLVKNYFLGYPLFGPGVPLFGPGVLLFSPGVPLFDPAKFGFIGMKNEMCGKIRDYKVLIR